MATKHEERMVEAHIEDAKNYATDRMSDAKNYADETKAKFDVLVADHPLAFVAGAFLGGLLVGKMISDRG
jgi:hypothetical protein